LEHRVAPKREILEEIKIHTYADHVSDHTQPREKSLLAIRGVAVLVGGGEPLSPNGLRAKPVACFIGLSDFRIEAPCFSV
jgi:hypothetical protein